MKKIIFFSLIIASVAACKTTKKAAEPVAVKKSPDCSNTMYTYAGDIKPIMDEHCLSCHNQNLKAGYNLGEIESVKRAGGNGYLLGTIKHESGYDPMPAHAEQLDQATINKIECWINTGMK